MGVGYSPVLYVGKEFEAADEATDFLRNHGLLTEVDEKVIEDNGLEGYMYANTYDLDGTTLNLYSGTGFVIGFDIGSPNPDTFKNAYDVAVDSWKKLFKEEPFDIVHAVCVW